MYLLLCKVAEKARPGHCFAIRYRSVSMFYSDVTNRNTISTLKTYKSQLLNIFWNFMVIDL